MNSIENSTKGLMKKNLKKIIINYSIIFIALSLCCYSYFIFNGKLLIWFQDGYRWHITRLLWFSKYLKSIVLNLFAEGKFIIPEFVYSFGSGGDIFEVASYGVLGDPFNLLSIFVPENLIAYFDHYVALIKSYLCGISFIYACCKLNKGKDISILAGAIIYVFCGWNILNIARHHIFLSPNIYFPLFILGIEYIFSGKKPYLYIIMLALYFVTSVMFSFHIVILCVVYVFVKLIYNRYSRKDSIKFIFKILLYSIISLFIASIVFIPSIFSIVGSGRVSKNYAIYFLYPISHYENMLKGLFLPELTNWVMVGCASPMLLFLISLIKNNKRRWDIKVFLLITLIFISIPIFGKMFNGFAYINNRYSWYISFLISYIVVIEWENLFLDNKKWFYILISLLYICICYITKNAKIDKLVFHILLIYIIIILFYVFKNNIKFVEIAIIYCICFSVMFNANYLFQYKKYVKECASAEKIKDAINHNSATSIIEFDGTIAGNYLNRYATTFNDNIGRNDSLVADFSSDASYSAISNDVLLDYSRFIGMDHNETNIIRGFEQKIIPYLLNATKYFSCKNDIFVPYGYEYIGNKFGYNVYKNLHSIDILYGYDNAMSFDKAKQYNVLERQELMLDNIILDGDIGSVDNHTNIVFANEKNNYVFEPIDKGNVIVNNNSIIVNKKNSKLLLKCNLKPDYEKHLILNNFKYTSLSTYDFYKNKKIFLNDDVIDIDPYNQFDFDLLSDKDKKKIKKDKLYFGLGNTEHNIKFRVNGEYDELFNIKTPYNVYYSWLDNFDINLHNFNGEINEIIITFPNIGVYTFDDIGLYSLPMDNFENSVENLRIKNMELISVGNDEVSTTIDIDKDKYICLAIPYSKHWKAYIDGKETKVSKANICYMCVNCPSGKHKIEFKYHNIYITYGQILSIFGVIVFIMMIIISKHNVYKKRED